MHRSWEEDIWSVCYVIALKFGWGLFFSFFFWRPFVSWACKPVIKLMAQRADWSPTKRSKIVLLSEQGCSYEEIRRKMGGNLTKGGISKFLKRYKETRSLENHAGKGRKRCTTASDDRRIKRLCLRDGRKSPGCIQDEMAQCNVKLSARTIRRRLQEFGLKSRLPRKKPLLPLKERLKSMTFNYLSVRI